MLADLIVGALGCACRGENHVDRLFVSWNVRPGTVDGLERDDESRVGASSLETWDGLAVFVADLVDQGAPSVKHQWGKALQLFDDEVWVDAFSLGIHFLD